MLQTTKMPLKATVEYSRHFSYSLERRMKPLFWVIEYRSIYRSLTDIFA
uniref:Uncharacterized protein n=1 Tax=Aegilops tauschii subsp. strangulata TaxID=200361 RepID=A0A453SFY6_AEGTS